MNSFPSNLTREDVLLLGKSIPKQEHIVFLGRPSFCDNSKYLFLAALKYGLPVIWCSVHDSLVSDLKQAGLPAHRLKRDEESFLKLITASHVIHSVSPIEALGGDELLEAATKHSKNVMLWHGISLKYLCLQRVATEGIFSPRAKFWISSAGSDIVLSTSKYFDSYWSEVFNARQVLRAGFPRNEVILRDPLEHELIGAQLTESLLARLGNGNPNVLIAPTWGNEKDKSLIDAGFIEKFSELAKTHEINLFIKLHHASYNKDDGLGGILTSRGIELIPAGLDVYPWLRYFSVLITDYSSIMFDFMLTGSPIVRLNTSRVVGGISEPALELMPDELPTYVINEPGDLDDLFSPEFTDGWITRRDNFLKQIFETDPLNACQEIIERLFVEDKFSD